MNRTARQDLLLYYLMNQFTSPRHPADPLRLAYEINRTGKAKIIFRRIPFPLPNQCLFRAQSTIARDDRTHPYDAPSLPTTRPLGDLAPDQQWRANRHPCQRGAHTQSVWLSPDIQRAVQHHGLARTGETYSPYSPDPATTVPTSRTMPTTVVIRRTRPPANPDTAVNNMALHTPAHRFDQPSAQHAAIPNMSQSYKLSIAGEAVTWANQRVRSAPRRWVHRFEIRSAQGHPNDLCRLAQQWV